MPPASSTRSAASMPVPRRPIRWRSSGSAGSRSSPRSPRSPIDGVTVNLIDTPGHPDFIAEVERVLSVLDGAVLVISAVEGVQPQTRVLMRALQRLRIPALLFVNKIDRPGAGEQRVLRAISERLSPAVVPMGYTSDLGTRDAGFAPWEQRTPRLRARLAEVLAERDERMLAAYVDDELAVPYRRLRRNSRLRPGARWCTPSSSAPRSPGRACAPLMTGLAELLPGRGKRSLTDAFRQRLQDRARRRPARRSPTSGCSRAQCGPATGCASGRGHSRQGDRDRACSSAGRSRPGRRSRPERSGSSGAWPRSRSATRSAPPPATRPSPMTQFTSSLRRRWNQSP